MSVNMNGFERQLVNSLQRQMPKREAEYSLYEIREAMYGDKYMQIKKEYYDRNGNTYSEYPTIKSLIWAYFNDGFEKLGYHPQKG